MLSRHLSARQRWKHHHCNEEMKARWRRTGRCSGGGVRMALQRPLALWGTPPNTTELLCTPKVEVSAAKGQALSRHTMGVCSSSRLANEQAQVTKPSSPQWLGLSCLAEAPLLASVGRAGQPNSWPFAKWTITSFCPHAQLVPCVYSRFSPSLGVSFAGEPCSSSRGALCS